MWQTEKEMGYDKRFSLIRSLISLKSFLKRFYSKFIYVLYTNIYRYVVCSQHEKWTIVQMFLVSLLLRFCREAP